jgi:hypothetical protein
MHAVIRETFYAPEHPIHETEAFREFQKEQS